MECETIPTFECKGSDGNIIRSADLLGKKLVIYFYPRDFTPGCTTEADEFTKMHQKFVDAGIQIIGVSPDTVESHIKFCRKLSIPYPLLADTDKTLSNVFGVWGQKKFMGREYMGVQRSTFLVDESGKMFKTYKNVRPKGHARQVLDAFMKSTFNDE